MAITRSRGSSRPVTIPKRPVCKFWLMGFCKYGDRCRFLHPTPHPSVELPAPTKIRRDLCAKHIAKAINPTLATAKTNNGSSVKSSPKDVDIEVSSAPATAVSKRLKSLDESSAKEVDIEGSCAPATPVFKRLQSLLESDVPPTLSKVGDGFESLARLEGHKEDVVGIAFPSGSNKLYTASRDGVLCLWDCVSGNCLSARNLGGEIGCLTCEGRWIFVGMRNLIKAWNVAETNVDELICLKEPIGLVNAIEGFDPDLLFGGTEDGPILAWRGTTEANSFKLIAALKGHTKAVLCLKVGRKRLYSSSMDHSVRVWDTKSFECLHVLQQHSASVTSLICWESYLLTASLDKTIKAWALTGDEQSMEVIYTHQEEQGLIAIDGMDDEDSKPVLFCSCDDNSVRLYDLPYFKERGRISSTAEVRTMYTGPNNLFFTGNRTGTVAVWKLLVQSNDA